MKYNRIYAFGENKKSGIRSRQVPVWRGLISIVLSVINSGPNNYYGIDRIPVCTGSGMYLHSTVLSTNMPTVTRFHKLITRSHIIRNALQQHTLLVPTAYVSRSHDILLFVTTTCMTCSHELVTRSHDTHNSYRRLSNSFP